MLSFKITKTISKPTLILNSYRQGYKIRVYKENDETETFFQNLNDEKCISFVDNIITNIDNTIQGIYIIEYDPRGQVSIGELYKDDIKILPVINDTAKQSNEEYKQKIDTKLDTSIRKYINEA